MAHRKVRVALAGQIAGSRGCPVVLVPATHEPAGVNAGDRTEPEPVDRVLTSDMYRYVLDPDSMGDPSAELLAAVAERKARLRRLSNQHRPTARQDTAP